MVFDANNDNSQAILQYSVYDTQSQTHKKNVTLEKNYLQASSLSIQKYKDRYFVISYTLSSALISHESKIKVIDIQDYSVV